MPGESKIEWTDATWNPVTGCTKVSAGCDHCYAETFAERWRGVPGHPYEQGFDLKLWPERLDIPLRWTKPRRVFVNSMSDLFHADVPDSFIDAVFGVMAGANSHTFQVLTKRPQRMSRYLNDPHTKYRIWNAGRSVAEGSVAPVRYQDWYDVVPVAVPGGGEEGCYPAVWPLPNVWLGTSVENQEVAWRIDWLVKTPAAVRFLSCEPLIGHVNLDQWLWAEVKPAWAEKNAAGRLQWVIAGGESGPRARPCKASWIESLADQCEAAGVPFFAKQLGAVWAREHKADPKGGNWDLWPENLRVREFPAIGVTP